VFKQNETRHEIIPSFQRRFLKESFQKADPKQVPSDVPQNGGEAELTGLFVSPGRSVSNSLHRGSATQT